MSKKWWLRWWWGVGGGRGVAEAPTAPPTPWALLLGQIWGFVHLSLPQNELFRLTRILPSSKFIFRCCVANRKPIVVCVSLFTVRRFEVNTKRNRSACDAVYLIQTQPELATQVPKAIAVFLPGSFEVHGSIETFLKHSPTAAVRHVIAEHLKGTTSVCRIYYVYTADLRPRSVDVETVLWYCMQDQNNCIKLPYRIERFVPE